MEAIPPNFPVRTFPPDAVTTEGTEPPAHFVTTNFSRVVEMQFLLFIQRYGKCTLRFLGLLLKYCSCRADVFFLLNFLS